MVAVKVELRAAPFDPWRELSEYEAANAVAGRHGAVAVFAGDMRDRNEGEEIISLFLDHYPEMTRAHLESICAAAREKWDLLDILVLHRIGEVRPGETIVLVAVWSEHRAAAYAANRFIMEDLKSSAPLWKRETLKSGARWVEKNTPGD
jgi:molybdopterin synthase catalytic subunit